MTDIRQGASDVAHEVLDMLEAAGAMPLLVKLGSSHLVETGSKDAAAAFRAKPDAGMKSRRREKALSAAVRLILAVELMDAGS